MTLDRCQSGNMCVLSYRQRQQKVGKISLAKEQGLEQVQDFVINDEIQKQTEIWGPWLQKMHKVVNCGLVLVSSGPPESLEERYLMTSYCSQCYA